MKKNLYIDSARNIVTYYAEKETSADGYLYDGFIEHDLNKEEWHVICLVYTSETSYTENIPDWGMCGIGASLAEAVSAIKGYKEYSLYPLMELFKR